MNTIPVLQLADIEEDRPMPSVNHSIVSQNLGGLLYAYRDKLSTHQQLSLNLDGWQSIPDLCIYRRADMPRDWINDQNECTRCPSLIIEVLSPYQNMLPLIDKCRDYLKHGVQACWVVLPLAHTIMVLPAKGPSRSMSEGCLSDDSLGIEIDIADVFL